MHATWSHRAATHLAGETALEDPVDALILDLLEWIGPGPRPYAEVMEAWRTSCPRLPVWEEAGARGLIVRTREPGREALVAVTASGREFLDAFRKHPTDRGAS